MGKINVVKIEKPFNVSKFAKFWEVYISENTNLGLFAQSIVVFLSVWDNENVSISMELNSKRLYRGKILACAESIKFSDILFHIDFSNNDFESLNIAVDYQDSKDIYSLDFSIISNNEFSGCVISLTGEEEKNYLQDLLQAIVDGLTDSFKEKLLETLEKLN